MDAESRWVELNAHRTRLIRLGRMTGLTREEAEDVASEAILRGARQPDLELERCGSWLHVVARHLAVDVRRRRPSAALLARVAHATADAHDPHERTLEQMEARWAAGLVEELPERQRHVLHLRAAGWEPAVIAEQLDVTYKAVESLTSRARTTVRQAIAKALGIGIALGALVRRLGRHQATPVVTAAAAVCFLALVVSSPHRASDPVRPQTPLDAGPLVERTVASPSRATHASRPARHVVAKSRPGRTETTVVAPQAVGPVEFGGLRTTRSTDDETFVASALRCLVEGPVVSPAYVGCTAP